MFFITEGANKKIKFDYIISLGNACDVAINLEDLSYHDHSYPFDWVISDMKSINELIDSKFRDLFNIQFLYRDPKSPRLVKHSKYCIEYYWDFSESVDIRTQLETVRKRYSRRIERLFNVLKSGKNVLFIRYLRNKKDSPDEVEEVRHFIDLMKKYSDSFKLILISNQGEWEPITSEFIVNHFFVEPGPETRNENPLMGSEVLNYVRNNIQYNAFHLLKNHIFKIRNQIGKYLKHAGMVNY